MNRSVWFVLAMLTVAGARAAILPTPQFNVLGVDDGLPSSKVYQVAQDRIGYLWFATSDGVARYDGVGFQIWRNDPDDKRTLPGNDVQALLIDREQRVWAGFEDGRLGRIDSRTGAIVRYQHDESAADSLAAGDVWALAEDAEGAIWVGLYGSGLDRIAAGGAGFEHFRHVDGAPASLPSDGVISVVVDQAGSLWVGSSTGVARLQPERQGQRTRLHLIEQWLPGETTVNLSLARDAGVYVGTRRRLYHLHPGQPAQAVDWPVGDVPVDGVVEDRAGALWVATHHGLLRRDDSMHWSVIRPNEQISGSLPYGVMLDALEDREGNLWFPTNSGVAQLQSNWRNFSLLRETGSETVGYGEGWIAMATACPDGAVWLAGGTGDLARLDPEAGSYERIAASRGEPNRLPAEKPYSIACLSDGSLLIAYRDRLLRFDPHSQTIVGRWGAGTSSVALLPGLADRIHAIAGGPIWLSARDAGVMRLDLSDNSLRRYAEGDSGLVISEVEQFKTDAHGVLWLVGEGGVQRFRADIERFESLAGAPAGRLDGVEFDLRGRMWLHGPGGLSGCVVDNLQLICEPPVHGPQRYETAAIGGLERAGDGSLWMAGPRGLLRFDPESRQAHRVAEADGQPVREFVNHPIVVRGDGSLLLPTSRGVLAFDPLALDRASVPPSLTVAALEARRDDRVLSFDPAVPVALQSRDRDLHVAIRALSLATPSANRYRFRLNPFDSDWVDAGTSPERTFSSLPSGHYELLADGANAQGVWSGKPVRLLVDVAPAPWRTPWAYLGYALSLVLLLFAAARISRARYEREHALALAQELRALAERESQMKTDFLTNVGHEIRAPMTGVLGMSELLLKTALDEQQRGFAQTVRSSGRHLLQLVDDLLDLSRIEAGKLAIDPQPTDLRALLAELAALHAAAARERGLQLSILCDASVPPLISIDPLRLRQIVINLTHNALKFTERGAVSVRAAAIDGLLEIVVIDSGPGLSAELQARLFERFEQGATSAVRHSGGSGLGLAICRELVGLMGGTIGCASEPGQGARFFVRLPLMVADASTASVDARADDNRAAGQALAILVADDDPLSREVISGLLQQEGHRPVLAEQALGALALLSQQSFDLGLIDLDMPVVDGFELLKLVRRQERCAAMALIAITARGDRAVETICRDAGFDGFLRKPFTREMLVDALRQLRASGAAG